ncbi:hypothetical protein ACFQ4L_05510 [Lapidilactobacillus mulanensis]|uniref:Uncharacterized protein n=1 Tax=Lapidilactobacillus mulanensis TaxID=2485999 RepID=A0ABW4DR11_9LACO|nr:hypothetical protein [Lapidilactobacillus mulanensis]
MTAIKQLTHQLTHQFKSFFDLDFETPTPIATTDNTPELADFDRAVLEGEIKKLQNTSQIVSLQIKNPAAPANATQFLIGRFKRTKDQHTFIFELSDSNMIQIIQVDQIVKIAA